MIRTDVKSDALHNTENAALLQQQNGARNEIDKTGPSNTFSKTDRRTSNKSTVEEKDTPFYLPRHSSQLRRCSSAMDLGRPRYVLALEHPAIRRLKSHECDFRRSKNTFEVSHGQIEDTHLKSSSSMGSSVFATEKIEDDVFEDDDVSMLLHTCGIRRLHCTTVKEHVRDGLVTVVSGLYGILLVVLGTVVPISETFIRPLRPYMIDMFYIYLYLVSIAFILFVYLFLLHNHTLGVKTIKKAISRTNVSGFRLNSKRKIKGRVCESSSVLDKSETSSVKPKSNKISFEDKGLDHGSFYLRLGALGFGMGSMILDGLYFAELFSRESPDLHSHYCDETLVIIAQLLTVSFTFIQLYFVFVNSKMKIIQHKIISKFGLMHMSATNLCVWLQTIVLETLHSMEETQERHSPRNKEEGIEGLSSLLYNKTVFEDDSTMAKAHCEESHFLGDVIASTRPYLYPLRIEYSLICAGILFVMWQNVEKRTEHRRLLSDESSVSACRKSKRIHTMSVDCSSSSRGLFMGIITFVAVVISLICFYTLLNKGQYEMNVLILSHVTEIFIYSITFIAIIIAAVRMHELKMKLRSDRLEETLILISLFGLYLFAFFSMVPGFMNSNSLEGTLTIISGVMNVIQASFQTIFILAGMRFTAKNNLQTEKKPGREFVTFLLLTNFSIWMIITLETQKPEHNQMQIGLYGPMAWSILVHVSVPLGIFYRFHSTVCLSHIWKHAWKWK